MQDSLVDIVSLALLVAFFGIQQRNRPQAYFRFWFAAWILVLVSLLAGALPTSHFPGVLAARELIRIDALFLAGFSFVLSFVARDESVLLTTLMGLLPVVPICTTISVAHRADSPVWLLWGLILLSEFAAAHIISKLVPVFWRWRRICLTLVCFASGAALLFFATLHDHAILVPQCILAQVFACASILYAGSTDWRSPEWLAGVIGFALWAVSSLIPEHPIYTHQIVPTLWQLWNLPKYAVGFSMTLRIFEGGRNDLVRLAQRYKVLYEDFRILYENHPLPMWIYDGNSGRFLSVNTSACASYGYTQAEFLDMKIDSIALPDMVPASLAQPPAGAHPGASRHAHHRRKDGSILATELAEHEILFQGQEARFMLAMDVTEREKLNLELIHQARHDALTGLPNRILLDDRIEQCLLRSTREHRKAVLFTIDADRFKLINDSFGHLVGDECLKEIANRLRSRIRSVDTIARTGGEEFTAIIGGLQTMEDAEKIASMFVHLFDTPLALSNQELKVSISVGGSIYPDDTEDPLILRRKSDQALYHAKRMGRNRFAFASADVCAFFDQGIAIEVALRNALKDDGFELFFQPMFDSNGRAVRLEALLRMRSVETLAFEPSLFIPVAEECGLILPIGAWVIEEACRHLARWRRTLGDEIGVAINVSGKQLLQRDFNTFVHETLARHGLPPNSIELELTETSLMTEPILMRDSMAELAQTGIQFAIDDFGTGYSSLARLADLPIALLKIDRSFITPLDRTQRANGIVTAIIQMAQTLQVRVVAEGVEDEAQLNSLLRKGCDLFQGFYLSRPMSAGEMNSAIEERNPILFAHPRFSNSRIAVSKRVRLAATQLPAFAGAEGGT